MSRLRDFTKGIRAGLSADRIMRKVAEYTEAHVQNTARATLDSTLPVYLRNLKVMYDEKRVEMTVRGPIANLQERGTSGFNLGAAILKGQKRVVIPFKHLSADARATTRAKPLGYALRGELGRAGAKAAGAAMEATRQFTGVYSGMREMKGASKSGAFARGGDFNGVTFRTITAENVAAGAWQYPNKQGMHALRSAMKAATAFLRQYVASAVKRS